MLIQMAVIDRIRQAEQLEAAAERRAVEGAPVDTPRLAARWPAAALALGALVIGLAWLTGMI